MENLPLVGGAGGGLLLLIIVLIVVMKKRKKKGDDTVEEEVVVETPDETFNEEDSQEPVTSGLKVEYNHDNHNIISVKLAADFPFTVHSITPEEGKYHTLFGAEGIIGRKMNVNKTFKIFLNKTELAKSKGAYSFKLNISFSKEEGTFTQALFISKSAQLSEAKITAPKAA